MRLPGACHVHFVRSALAHARIAAIDVSAALEAPGVIAVFTGADLADMPVPPPPMAGMINAEMGQPLLAAGVVRYVGEPVAVVVTEGRYQGEDAGDLVDVDYDVLTPVIDMTTAADDGAPVLFPAAGTNVAASFGDRAALAADLFDGCEVVVSRTIVNQRVAPAPMETRAAAAVLGRGRPAHRVDPEPGRPGHPLVAGRHARHRRGRPADHHPGRGRRVRRQVRRRPGARGGLLGRPAAGAARALDRDPQREPGRHDPRPGPDPEGHHRRQPGRDGGRLPDRDPAGLRGLPEVRRVPALPDHLDGARALRLPARRGGGDVGGDQHHPGRRLPRRGPPGGHRGGGAGHGPVRRRDRRGPGRGAPQEPAARLHRAAHHRVRRGVRQRRLRDRAGQGAGRGGLPGPAAGAGQAAGRRRRGPARHRPVLLRGDHRGGRRGGRRQGERHRRGPPRRERHHLDRDLSARPGPSDRVGHAGQRGARHPGGPDHPEVG